MHSNCISNYAIPFPPSTFIIIITWCSIAWWSIQQWRAGYWQCSQPRMWIIFNLLNFSQIFAFTFVCSPHRLESFLSIPHPSSQRANSFFNRFFVFRNTIPCRLKKIDYFFFCSSDRVRAPGRLWRLQMRWNGWNETLVASYMWISCAKICRDSRGECSATHRQSPAFSLLITVNGRNSCSK